jgi:glycosyltransferase involved in cell wall biosynthesis
MCADGPALGPNSYRNAVGRYFMKHGDIAGLSMVFVEQPAVTVRFAQLNRRLMTLTRGIGWQPLYYAGLDRWHQAALRTARDLGIENFDLVHQLTPISFIKPGYLWSTGLPFFWGPIGGMYKVPWDFARTGGMSSFLLESIRSCNIDCHTRLSGRFRSIVSKAKRIWTISADEGRILSALADKKISPMLETSAPEEEEGHVRHYDGVRPLRICWSGTHETRKALPLVLHALKLLPGRDRIVLDILGEGPETQRWQLIAKKLSLTNITWHGRLPYRQARKTMGQADMLIHSSFREGTPHVVMEALGWGIPVICHDACGMASAVDDTCGIKIPLINQKRSIYGFRDAMNMILQYPGLVEQMSKGALRRASQMSWDEKVNEISETYVKFA